MSFNFITDSAESSESFVLLNAKLTGLNTKSQILSLSPWNIQVTTTILLLNFCLLKTCENDELYFQKAKMKMSSPLFIGK